MLKPLRIPACGLLFFLLSGCLITTPETIITVSGFQPRDSGRVKRVCAAVATRHGLAVFRDEGGIVSYAKPMRAVFGQRQYVDPAIGITEMDEMRAIVLVSADYDTADRRKLADDAFAAFQHEFGARHVQRRDERATEF
jgi:hypothetical protein